MFKVLLSRLGQAALVMLVVSAVSFVMFRYVGDPVATMSRENASVEEKAELRRSLGLDQPLAGHHPPALEILEDAEIHPPRRAGGLGSGPVEGGR